MDEIELIHRCKLGEYNAFESLYQLYVKKALRTAFMVTRSRPAAEDAVQEAFVQVWRRIGSLREATAFRAWFYRILLHEAHRLNKKNQRGGLMPLEIDQHDKPDLDTPMPDEQVEYADDLQALRAAIAALPDIQRLPLMLRYYSGLTEAEIAEVLGIPVGTVKSRLHNARQALQRCLAITDHQSMMQAVPDVLAPQPRKEAHARGGRTDG